MKAVEIRQRFDQLTSLRSTLDDTLQKIEKYVVPYRAEFFTDMSSEAEVTWRRRGIYDSTAPIAADLLASSIHSNLTSPMIPWFHLKFRDNEINEKVEAKKWLEKVQAQIWQTLKESDFNMEVAEVYLDLVSFGTAILFQEEMSDTDWEGLTYTALPIQDCYFEHGADDKVLRVFRVLRYTKMQLMDKWPDHDFGECADDPDQKHKVVFCVYYRDEVTETQPMMAPEARPVGFKYVLHDSSEELEEGGYYQFPASVVRWKKVSGSRWGHSPAFVALSDILQLNETVAMTSEARAKEIDPPMKSTERGVVSDLDLLPGGLTMVTEMDELDRLLDPNPTLFQSNEEIIRLQESIRSTFYVDKLELKESPAMTATEVLARLDKQQRQFAPTLGRLEYDLLDPLIESVFDILMRKGLLPEPPDVVRETELDIEYVGPIPRSMKNEEAQGTSMWLNEMVALAAQGLTDITDVINTDAAARGLGLARGVPAAYMNEEDLVTETRAQRAAQQQKMMEMQMQQQQGEADQATAGAEQMAGA